MNKHMIRGAVASNLATGVVAVVGVIGAWTLLKGLVVMTAASTVVGLAVGVGSALLDKEA